MIEFSLIHSACIYVLFIMISIYVDLYSAVFYFYLYFYTIAIPLNVKNCTIYVYLLCHWNHTHAMGDPC